MDPAGNPVPGIQIGRLIAPNYDAGLDRPSDHLEVYPIGGSKKPASTDADGRFTVAPGSTLIAGPVRSGRGPSPFASPIKRSAGFTFCTSTWGLQSHRTKSPCGRDARCESRSSMR